MCPLDVIKTRLQVHGPPEMHPSGRRGVFAKAFFFLLLMAVLRYNYTPSVRTRVMIEVLGVI